MKLHEKESGDVLNKKDFISPFSHDVDIRKFIQD